MRLKLLDAKNILQNYNLGEVISTKRLTSGYSNINYKIKTTKGNFLFRICAEKSLDEIQYEIKVLNELKKNRYPAAFPIERKDKQYINKTKFGEVLLYDYIEGEEPEINEKTVKEIAKAVAKLNSFKDWKRLNKINAINLSLCNSNIKKFSSSKNKYPEIFEYFKEQTKFLTKSLNEKLPQGLVHGDIFPDNTKFKGNKLAAILDFEEVCVDNILFDVGVTINGFCFKNNRLNQKLLNIFLDEYQKIRKLTPKELKLLPDYIQWGAHAMISWHLKHLLNKKETKKLNRVKWYINRVKRLRKLPPSFF